MILQVCGARRLACLWVSGALCSWETAIDSPVCSVGGWGRESLENKTRIPVVLEPTEQCMDEPDSHFSSLKVTPGPYGEAMTANHSPYSFCEQVSLAMWLHSPACTRADALTSCFVPVTLTHHLKGLFKLPSPARQLNQASRG